MKRNAAYLALMAGDLTTGSPLPAPSKQLRVPPNYRISLGVSDAVGDRVEMEDRVDVRLDINREFRTLPALNGEMFRPHSWFAVYDGHRMMIDQPLASEFARTRLLPNITTSQHFSAGNYEAAIRFGIRETDRQFFNSGLSYDSIRTSGTTITAALIVGAKMYLVNLGDSATILGRKSSLIAQTRPHIPNDLDENKRIMLAGGCVEGDKLTRRGPDGKRDAPLLALTRALGDYQFKPDGVDSSDHMMVSNEPDILAIDMVEDPEAEDSFLLLASDGLEATQGSKEAQEAIDMADRMVHCNSETCQAAAEQLISFPFGGDNASCILVRIHR